MVALQSKEKYLFYPNYFDNLNMALCVTADDVLFNRLYMFTV